MSGGRRFSEEEELKIIKMLRADAPRQAIFDAFPSRSKQVIDSKIGKLRRENKAPRAPIRRPTVYK